MAQMMPLPDPGRQVRKQSSPTGEVHASFAIKGKGVEMGLERILKLLEQGESEVVKHPKSYLLDQFFLYPDKLAVPVRDEIAKHVAECQRCESVEAYYREHRESLLAFDKIEPCD